MAAPSSSTPSGSEPADHARGLHAEDGAQALASGKDAVAHGLMNGSGILRAGGQEPLQRRVGSLLTVEKSFFQHGRFKVYQRDGQCFQLGPVRKFIARMKKPGRSRAVSYSENA